MAPTTSAKFFSQSCEWSPVSTDTNTVMPRPSLSGSMSATRRRITPSASSRCKRFQQGVEDSPTRCPISATESEASSCTTARILRSMASMLSSLQNLEAKPKRWPSIRIFLLFAGRICLYREKYSISRTISVERKRSILQDKAHVKEFSFFCSAPLRRPPRCRAGAGAAGALGAEAVAPLVGVDWLKAHLNDPNLVVLDIRSAIDGGGVKAYEAAHIPGSVHSDYDKAGWRVTRNNVPFMVPTAAELEKLIGDLGIDEDTHVVVVPAGVNVLDFGSAARTYWTLKYVGVKNVSILDGGVAAWRSARLPVETGTKAPSPKIFTATVDKSILAEAADVESIEGKGGATLIDARPASFFLGKEKAPASKAYGHIPGALNIDSAEFYDAKSNRLKPK